MTLTLTDDVDVRINLSPLSTVRNGFNIGLILGESGVIPVEERLRLYNDPSEMIDDGFADDDPEYLAAQLYCSATSQPTKFMVGTWDSGSTNAETAEEAVQACRDANAEWCTVCVCGASDEEIKSVAALVEALEPETFQMATTQDSRCLSSATNIFSELKALNYSKTFVVYHETANAVAAVQGYAMGANTGLRNSAYTLKFKRLVGLTASSLTPTQVSTYIKANKGNCYVNRGGAYDMLEDGTMCDGSFFDERINLAKLKNDIQLNIMDVLYQNPKVAQTEDDMVLFYDAIAKANEKARTIKFIHQGIWNKPNILNLKTGDTLPNGYVIQSESIDGQDQADRDLRLAPPIYDCVKLAGAIHSATIQINVNR